MTSDLIASARDALVATGVVPPDIRDDEVLATLDTEHTRLRDELDGLPPVPEEFAEAEARRQREMAERDRLVDWCAERTREEIAMQRVTVQDRAAITTLAAVDLLAPVIQDAHRAVARDQAQYIRDERRDPR